MVGSAKFVARSPWAVDLTPDELVARYKAGASLFDLALLTGSSPYFVRQDLVAQGVTIRPPRSEAWGRDPMRFVKR